MYCRVLEGKAKPGGAAQAIDILVRQLGKLKKTGGLASVQIMQSGDEVLAISSWQTEKDLRAYAASQLAREMLDRLTAVLEQPASVRSFEIKLAVQMDEEFLSPDQGGEG